MSKKTGNSLFRNAKTPVGSNSASIEEWAMNFACSMGFSATAHRMTWPSLSHDRQYTHLQVVCLRLEGNLVLRVLLSPCLSARGLRHHWLNVVIEGLYQQVWSTGMTSQCRSSSVATGDEDQSRVPWWLSTTLRSGWEQEPTARHFSRRADGVQK